MKKLVCLLSMFVLCSVMAQAQNSNDKKIRIALCGIQEEVNTFATETMGYATITGNLSTGFQRYAGQEMIDVNKGTLTWPGGWVDAFLEESQVEFIPVAYYGYSAGPTIEGKAYQTMKQDILETLKAALPLDGIAVQLHGAGVADGVEDIEDDLVVAIRQLVGPDVKIVCALDHHCNNSDILLKQMDYITIVKEYPHTDMHESSYRSAKMLIDMINGKPKPYGYFEHIPILHSTQTTMPGGLHAPIRDKVIEFSKRKGIYEFSYGYGFPFADVSNNTPVVNCWAETPELAESTAKEFAALLWKYRDRFVVKPLSADKAVENALETLVKQGRVMPEEISKPMLIEESSARVASADLLMATNSGFVPDKDSPGPIVIAEKSDNPGGGAPGDATHVLRQLIDRKVQQAAVVAIRDPETVKQAMAAGVGKIIDVKLGGKYSKLGGSPIVGKAYVKCISDGKYTIQSPMGQGMKMDVGPAVGLIIEGVDVAVISGTMQAFDAEQMKIVGFDPMKYRVIVVKSANHFRAWWPGIASNIIDCDPPGIASNDLTTFTFKNKKAKAYPLDKDAVYPEPASK